jgi:hypothetical protein
VLDRHGLGQIRDRSAEGVLDDDSTVWFGGGDQREDVDAGEYTFRTTTRIETAAPSMAMGLMAAFTRLRPW